MDANSMTDNQTIEASLSAFYSLSDQDMAKLKDLNMRIQNHDGEWGKHKGGEKTASGAIQMPWVQNDPLIYEFLDFMFDRNLLPLFDWTSWSEGSDLFVLDDQAKYDNVSTETALKLIYAATRKERFADGTLAWAFNSGNYPKLVNRLVALGAQQND